VALAANDAVGFGDSKVGWFEDEFIEGVGGGEFG